MKCHCGADILKETTPTGEFLKWGEKRPEPRYICSRSLVSPESCKLDEKEQFISNTSLFYSIVE